MSMGSGWNAYSDAESRKARDAAERQAYQAEQRRLEMQQWERNRQLFQESILQQEQSRRGRESDKRGSNEELGINKNFDLGIYGEDTKRRAQDKDLEKSKLGNETARYGFDKMSGMFGGMMGGGMGGGISLHDNAGNRIGGTYQGGGSMRPLGSGGYQTQNFTLRDSLLRNG